MNLLIDDKATWADLNCSHAAHSLHRVTAFLKAIAQLDLGPAQAVSRSTGDNASPAHALQEQLRRSCNAWLLSNHSADSVNGSAPLQIRDLHDKADSPHETGSNGLRHSSPVPARGPHTAPATHAPGPHGHRVVRSSASSSGNLSGDSEPYPVTRRVQARDTPASSHHATHELISSARLFENGSQPSHSYHQALHDPDMAVLPRADRNKFEHRAPLLANPIFYSYMTDDALPQSASATTSSALRTDGSTEVLILSTSALRLNYSSTRRRTTSIPAPSCHFRPARSTYSPQMDRPSTISMLRAMSTVRHYAIFDIATPLLPGTVSIDVHCSSFDLCDIPLLSLVRLIIGALQ